MLLPELLFGREPVPGLEEDLEALARTEGVRLAVGYMAPGPKNRLRIFPDGPSYDKLHPYLALGEEGDEGVVPGEEPVLWRGPWRMGLAICYDLDFPELFRGYALRGAEAFLVAAAWPGAYGGVLEVLARARAAENQAYLILANRADQGAPSLAVRPDGTLLARREEEGLSLVELDRGFLEAYRARYPILRHRRPERYWA